MAQLARRIDELLREHGLDPSAWQGEVQSLRALEDRDEKAAQERFHELKRALLVMRRSDLLRELREHPWAQGVPPLDAKGLDVRELEREIKWATAAVRRARQIADGQEEIARTRLRERAPPPAPEMAPRAWDDLEPLERVVDEHRRALAREARVEALAADLAKRARKLERVRVEVPATANIAAAEAFDLLAPVEAGIAQAERVEAAYDAAIAPLRSPAVRAYKAQTRRALEREANEALAARDISALDAVREKALALDREAAATEKQAVRSRRAGAAPPTGERRAGDMHDGYG